MSLLDCPGPLAAAHDLVMLDLDGVVYRGPDAVPGAAEALQSAHAAGTGLAYLTNNASRPAGVVADHLRELGMPLDDDGDVITSAQAIARVMADDLPSGSAVLVVGGAGLRESLDQVGLRPVDRPDHDTKAVVQGFDAGIGWSDLAEAAYAVAGGLPWYASNTDLTVPTARGIAPGNGSLVHAVRLATGLEPTVAGKPERPLFDETLRRTGAERPLMVGDRLDTDIHGARSLGLPSLWVATGVDDLAGVVAADPALRPTFVGPDLSALHAPQPAVEVDDDEARCGSARVVLSAGSLTLRQGEAGTVEVLRAAVALGWQAVDSGHEVPGLDDTMRA